MQLLSPFILLCHGAAPSSTNLRACGVAIASLRKTEGGVAISLPITGTAKPIAVS